MRKFVVALLGTALLASTAMGGFTVTEAGPYDSNGPYPDALNGVFTYEYTGADFAVGDVVFSGDLTSGDIGSYLSEARVNITDPLGSTAGWSPASGGSWTGTHSIVDQVVGGGGAFWTGTAGTWTFEFSETYNDGGDDVDAIWSNLSFEFQDYVAPEAPDALAVSLPYDAAQNIAAAGDVLWFSFSVGAGDGLIDIWTEAADPAPIGDTEIGLYDVDGNLVANNDDGGPAGGYYSGLMEQTLDAGMYYLAVGGYNSSFAAGWDVDGGTATGDFMLHITPEPASLLLLAVGALVIRRR